jgi:sulfonate transport system substrate-binding protein
MRYRLMQRAGTILVAVVVMIIAAGCGKSDNAAATGTQNNSGSAAKEIRIAIQPFTGYAPLLVAKQKGWFEEEFKKLGVTVKYSYFDSGPVENEAFAAGQQDVGVMGDLPAIIAKSAGQKTKIIGTAAVGAKSLAILVPPNSDITSPKYLKGKKLAVVKGSNVYHLLAVVLKNNGLSFDDVKIINMPVADMATALANKNIDAAATWEPYITKLEAEGVAKVLIDGEGLKRANSVILARGEFAEENPELIKAFLRIYQNGVEFVKANSKETAEVIHLEVKVASDYNMKILQKYSFDANVSREDIDALKQVEQFMREADIIKTKVDIDTFVDTSYLK